ncbi:MAG: alpha/beta hydrolase family protein [Candidatus Cryptobacteroides sp.]
MSAHISASSYMRKIAVLFLSFLTAFFTAAAQTGTWSGNIDINGIRLPLVFHLDSEEPTMDSPEQGATGIPVEVERTEIGAINIKIPSIGASYKGFYLAKQIVGTFIQAGKEFPLTLVPGENRPKRPQTPVGPFPYEQEEVSFANGTAVLKGTLLLPQGWDANTPVFLMVTGSGLQNRDEEIFGHKPFAVLADALSRAGIATLRYDDRGTGESSGDIFNYTIEDLKNDASAGIDFLKERFGKVGVIGHSEGGTIAFMLAAEGRADFIVSLAAAVSMSETLLWQNRVVLIASGYSEETADAYCALLAEAFESCICGNPLPSAANRELPDELELNYQALARQLKTQYISRMLEVDLRPSLAYVTCPVLALNGTKDTQVDPESNLSALRESLPQNQKTCIMELEGLNHLFQHCTSGLFSEYKLIEETFAPEAIELIVQWARKNIL